MTIGAAVRRGPFAVDRQPASSSWLTGQGNRACPAKKAAMRWTGACLMLLGCLLLVGCQSSEAARGPVVVTYWEKWTEFEGEAMKDVVDEFNRRHSDIRVELLTISQVDRKMLMATAGNIPPDVAGLWSYNVIPYADRAALLPLERYCAGAGMGPEDYISSYWHLCTHRGHVWALPTTPASIALHWNKKLFREAGLDPERPPRTIEELDQYARRLTRRDANGEIVRMGFMPAEPGWWNWAWGCFFGGRLWDGQSKITAASPQNIRAYEWVQSYAREYGIQNLQVFQSGFGNFSSPQNAFLAGKVAMELQGVWMHNFIDKYTDGMEWGAAPFPYPAGRPDLADTTVVEEDVLLIPAGAKHPDEAFEFIKWVNSQEGMELLCLGQRKHTPLVEVSDAFLAQHPNPYIEVFIGLAKSRNALVPPQMGLWQEYQSTMNEAFDKIWLCRATPEEALRDVERRMQKKLDREIRRYERMGLEYAGVPGQAPRD